MATSYKELGLVNTKELFAKAVKGGYAIPAYNFNNLEQLQASFRPAWRPSLPSFFRFLPAPESTPTLLC